MDALFKVHEIWSVLTVNSLEGREVRFSFFGYVC